MKQLCSAPWFSFGRWHCAMSHLMLFHPYWKLIAMQVHRTRTRTRTQKDRLWVEYHNWNCSLEVHIPAPLRWIHTAGNFQKKQSSCLIEPWYFMADHLAMLVWYIERILIQLTARSVGKRQKWPKGSRVFRRYVQKLTSTSASVIFALFLAVQRPLSAAIEW